MFTPSTRTLLILVVGIALVLNSFAAAGIAFAEPAAERDTHAHHSTDSIDSTGDSFDRSSSSSVSLSVASSTVTSIVFLAGHSRSDGTDPLEHDLRKELHDDIHQTSGTYVSDLRETYDIHRSTLRYHLDVLERRGLVSSDTIFGQLWYAPAGSDGNELRAALTNDTIGELVDSIALLEPVSVTDLASEVERSPSTVSYHLERLEYEGIIEQERRSTTVLSRLASDVRTEFESLEDSAGP